MPATKLTPTNSGEFLEANKEAIVVLIFDAEFSGQQDIVEEATKALVDSDDLKEKILVASVDVEANNELATQFSVVSVPTIAIIKGQKVLRKIDTLEPKKLVSIVQEILKMIEIAPDSSQTGDAKAAFNEYLKRLTTRAPIMIFMKGSPDQPRCGFSKQLVELLSKHKIKYESFDILQDEDVRQGLKDYSDWPTYPQIYKNGEFVGGLDILKEQAESGQLESYLTAEQ